MVYKYDQNNPLSLYFVNKLSDHAHTNNLISYAPLKDAHSHTKMLRGGGIAASIASG